MRLSTLHPTLEDVGDGAMRLEFDCPAHGAGAMRPGGEFPDRVEIIIAAPLEPQGGRTWGWNGETDFEKLTISPSVNYNDHWHGHVKDGEVSTV